jgi:DNA-binding transcriptional ArsR family regulator
MEKNKLMQRPPRRTTPRLGGAALPAGVPWSAPAALGPATQAAIPKIARALKVCGHPVRLKLLRVILSSKPCVTDLWQCVREPQPVVSQHLAVLKREHIVASRIEGNRRIYSVTDAWVRDLVSRIP